MSDQIGEKLIRAAAAGKFEDARALLSDDVEFRALTPPKVWEADDPDGVVEILEEWFGPAEVIEALESETVVDRPGVRYRGRWASDEGTFVFAQQEYYDAEDGRIGRIHIVCSGDRPVEGVAR